MDERRKDYDGRRRIEQLELRYRRVTHALVGGMAAIGLTLVIGFLQLGRRADEAHRITQTIQRQRFQAIRGSCEQRNADHRAIVGFVTTVAPDLHGKAATQFPVMADCRAYARTQVKEP